MNKEKIKCIQTEPTFGLLTFLPREHMRGRASRNSVRPSVTRVHCDKTK